MTQITLERSRVWGQFGTHTALRSAESPLPKPPLLDGCPNCRAELNKPGDHSLHGIKAAFKQFLASIFGFVGLLIRLVRLVAGMAVGLVGIVGCAMRAASVLIVHPDDRRLLPGSGRFEI